MATARNREAETFAECLLADIYGCLMLSTNVDLNLPEEREIERGNLPHEFYCDIMRMSQFVVVELREEVSQLTSLLFFSEELFRKLVDHVSTRLIAGVDPDVGFLKVMSFLILFIVLSFLTECYHLLDFMPLILRKLLLEKIQTRFYIDGEFDAVYNKVNQLIEDEQWCDATLQEMRTSMDEVLQAELPTISYYRRFDEPDRKQIKIAEVKLHADKLRIDETYCPYCGMRCMTLLRAFYKPAIMYKPEHPFYRKM